MSLARAVVNDVIASRTTSVVLNDTQKQEMQQLGLTPTDNASWFQAMDLEVNRRMSSSDWHAALQYSPPKDVLVEIAVEIAIGNYIAWKNYQQGQQTAVVEAAHLAAKADEDRKPPGPMPSPEMAGN